MTTSISTHSPSPRWPVYLLAAVGLIVASPFILALLGIGLALTLGVAVLAVKVGLLALAIWAVVSLFRALFGSSRAEPRADGSRELEEALRMVRDDETDRESLAALDKELALALAKKNAAEAR